MKCLKLTSDREMYCVPLSKVEEIALEFDGIDNGVEQWKVCVRYYRVTEWHESYNDYAAAMKHFNELVAILEENENERNS
jgi:hypothetical protein